MALALAAEPARQERWPEAVAPDRSPVVAEPGLREAELSACSPEAAVVLGREAWPAGVRMEPAIRCRPKEAHSDRKSAPSSQQP